MEKILVGVHWNSHKSCWSVVNFKSRRTVGLLRAHMPSLSLEDVSFKVDLSKKRKALEKGSKDRHTFIVGYLNNVDNIEVIGDKIQYKKDNNIEPFISSQGNSLVGESLYFGEDGRVYKK